MKTKLFTKLLLFPIMLYTISTKSQTLEWVKTYGGDSWDYGNGIATDATGNVYTTGVFDGTIDLDPGPGTNLLAGTAGVQSLFVLKHDPMGNLIWAKSVTPSLFSSISNTIAVDANNNVFVAGYFNGTIDFDSGIDTVSASSNNFSNDAFILKLNSNGDVLFVKSFGGNSGDEIKAISIDTDGNIYTTGIFIGTANFDPNGTYTMTSSGGSQDMFVSKLDNNGNFLWAKKYSGASNNMQSVAIKVDNYSSVYTSGFFSGTVDFDPSASTYDLISGSANSSFIAKLDTAGNFKWAKSFGNTMASRAHGVTTDPSGDVYTTGFFQGTIDFDPNAGTADLTTNGNSDIYIVKLDSLGNYLWAKNIGGPSGDAAYAICVENNQVYTTGSFQSIVDFDPGVNTNQLGSVGGSDIFISILTANNGDYVGAHGFGSNQTSDKGSAIAARNDGSYYCIGIYEATTDFNPPNLITMPTNGVSDVFVLKRSPVVINVQSLSNSNELKVYPNPNNGDFIIEFNKPMANAIISITNILGQEVFHQKTSNNMLLPIHINGDNGFYIVTVKTENETFVIKTLKQ